MTRDSHGTPLVFTPLPSYRRPLRVRLYNQRLSQLLNPGRREWRVSRLAVGLLVVPLTYLSNGLLFWPLIAFILISGWGLLALQLVVGSPPRQEGDLEPRWLRFLRGY